MKKLMNKYNYTLDKISAFLSKFSKYLMPIFIIGLFGMIFLRDIFGVNISKFIFLAFISLFLLFTNKAENIYILCFVFPLLNGLPGTYILLVGLVLLVLRKAINLKSLIFIAVFACLELVASIWFPNKAYFEIVKYGLHLATFFLLLHGNLECDYRKCLSYFFIGTVILSLIVTIVGLKWAPDNWLSLFSRGRYRFGDRNKVTGTDMLFRLDANELGYNTLVGIFAGLVLVLNAKKRYIVPLILGVILDLLAGIFSLSRTFILFFAIVIVLFVIFSFPKKKGNYVFFFIIPVLVIFVKVLFMVFPDFLGGIVTRMTNAGMSNAGGRVEIFKNYFTYWSKNIRAIFIGTGVTQYKGVLNYDPSIHNMLQQILICYGVIGFIAFMYVIVTPLIKEMKNKPKLVYYLPWLAAFLFVQAIQFVNPYYLMFNYLIGVFTLRYGSSLKKEQLTDSNKASVNQ